MRSMDEVLSALRRNNRKSYRLLCGCCFFSVLLITAYVSMMRAPTVLAVLPEGGDSRKQVMMIFLLAVLGCGVFTVYAAGLFFRSKSRDTGIFFALGGSRTILRRALYRELAWISLGACGLGALLGTPLAWGLWQIFRLAVVDSAEMVLRLDPQAYLLALAFSAFVVGMLFVSGRRFLRRTDIIAVVNEARRSEPIRRVRSWYGWVGILLMIAGALLGYLSSSFFVLVCHWYPPEGLSTVFYLPLFAGLYMVLLHTVVNGWGRANRRCRNIISTSMMKFQGRQTVRNMLVITVLIAGSYFAAFYTPMQGTSAMMEIDRRPTDYAYHFRADQDIPQREEVLTMAQAYGVALTDWAQAPMARLGVDGMHDVETDKGALGTTYEEVYQAVACSRLFLSESAYEALTGETAELEPGQIAGIFDSEGNGMFSGEAHLVTNCLTGRTLHVQPAERLKNDLLQRRFVLDDGDYAAITRGLDDTWREEMVFFNVKNCEDTYDFAKALFNEIVDRTGPEAMRYDSWDPAIPEVWSAYTAEPLEPDQRDSSEFRLYWQYMPQFRVLDRADFVRTTAVFLMLFIFISIICFAAVAVIAYTRSMTLAAGSAPVYEDLRRLGANRAYLRRCLAGQLRRIWATPIAIGTAGIYFFYTIIMYFNGRRNAITSLEAAGLLSCAILVVVLSLFFYILYRLTYRRAAAVLKIS